MKFLAVAFLTILTLVMVTPSQSAIRRVDFKNFTYLAQCVSDTPENVTVRNGEFSEEKQADGYIDRFRFRVSDIAYGDLDGDGGDEAIVLTVCNTGGSGNFSEGFVFALKKGKPSLIARIPGGDRAHGGLRSTRVENGLLVVESNDPGPEGGACCPQIIITTRYKLVGKQIVQSGKESRRDVYPTERVTFARGSSGRTFRITIPVDQGKRLIVGARAGQTLSVSVDSEKASLRLLEEADVKFGINNFMVRLPAEGDYTIEIRNDSDADLDVVLNVKIQ